MADGDAAAADDPLHRIHFHGERQEALALLPGVVRALGSERRHVPGRGRRRTRKQRQHEPGRAVDRPADLHLAAAAEAAAAAADGPHRAAAAAQPLEACARAQDSHGQEREARRDQELDADARHARGELRLPAGVAPEERACCLGPSVRHMTYITHLLRHNFIAYFLFLFFFLKALVPFIGVSHIEGRLKDTESEFCCLLFGNIPLGG